MEGCGKKKNGPTIPRSLPPLMISYKDPVDKEGMLGPIYHIDATIITSYMGENESSLKGGFVGQHPEDEK